MIDFQYSGTHSRFTIDDSRFCRNLICYNIQVQLFCIFDENVIQ